MQPQLGMAAGRSIRCLRGLSGATESSSLPQKWPRPARIQWECLAGSKISFTPPTRQTRSFANSCRRSEADTNPAPPASNRNEENGPAQGKELDDAIAGEKEKQARAPWHREGSDLPPVKRQRSAGAMTKGKLLTTPSRLLKLIVPLTTSDRNSDRKDVEPLALLVHPQQPLSYLERLIQSELPSIKDAQGEPKIPAVYFRAEDSFQDALMPQRKQSADQAGDLEESADEQDLRGGPGEGGVELYSGLGHERDDGAKEKKFVRWSPSTEIGDFIRDAARGAEFAIEIEGAPHEIRVGAPSFNDRTHYLRTRLRKTSSKIADMASIKKECDEAAHRGGQRVAFGGFGLMVAWWYVVYWCTFETELTWDVMEPVTYLVGLGTVMGGYLWFLYHNREVSYRSALNLTVSRRQTKLYHSRNFDIKRWESLIEEGNALRKEIKAVANEYDVEWDETADEQDERVTEALEESRGKKEAAEGKEKQEKKKKRKDDDDEGED